LIAENKKSHPKKYHYIAGLLAYFLWGMTFPFSKLVIPPVMSITFVAIRTLLGFIILFSIILINKEFKEWVSTLKKHFWALVILGAAFYTLSYVVQFYAIQFTTAINQSIISQTATLWVVLINFLVFKQKPAKKFIFAFLFGIAGVILILISSNFDFSTNTLKGDFLSLITFLLWGSYIAFSKPLSMKIKATHMVSIMFLVGLVILIPLSIAEGGVYQLQQLNGFQWGILVYLGVFCTGFTYLLQNFALSNKDVPSEHISYLMILLPVVSVIFSLIFLEEVLTWSILVGGLLIIFSVIIVNQKPKQIKIESGKTHI
jgi:drug/metabolite transporter (DMT)-like permease